MQDQKDSYKIIYDYGPHRIYINIQDLASPYRIQDHIIQVTGPYNIIQDRAIPHNTMQYLTGL